VQRSALGGIDQALGFLFGAARGVLLIAIAFIVYDRVLSDQRIEMVDNSAAPRWSSRTSSGRSTTTSPPMRRAGSSNAITS
jgi:membrane protein required for colicin V production